MFFCIAGIFVNLMICSEEDKTRQDKTAASQTAGLFTCLFVPSQGKDVKSNLFDNENWKNADFEQARSSANKTLSYQYASLEESWWEQRHWCVTTFLETLLAANHSMAAGILAELELLSPQQPC